MTENRHGQIELDYGDGTYSFRLSIGGIEELEDKTDRSIFQLYEQMQGDVVEARVRDYVEVLRIGLIGGGMDPVDARKLVDRYTNQRPLQESSTIACIVLASGLVRQHGAADEDKVSEKKSPTSE